MAATILLATVLLLSQSPDFASLPPPPPPPPPMPAGYESTKAEFDKLMAGKRYAAAAAVWEKLIKSNPEVPPPHYLRAQALLLAGERQAADAGLRTAWSSMAGAPAARLMAGTYLMDLVSGTDAISAADAKIFLTEARTLIDDALQKNPKYWEAMWYQSQVMRTQAKYETDQVLIKKLTAEADRLRAQADKMRPK